MGVFNTDDVLDMLACAPVQMYPLKRWYTALCCVYLTIKRHQAVVWAAHMQGLLLFETFNWGFSSSAVFGPGAGHLLE
jgi:hypothetical protein